MFGWLKRDWELIYIVPNIDIDVDEQDCEGNFASGTYLRWRMIERCRLTGRTRSRPV